MTAKAYATAETLAIAWIGVGERRREDLGDLEGLAASIKRYGLIHPPVVDDENRLVAGERRLRACQMLGWTEIDVRRFSNLTDSEKSEIELEENLRRKDLTPGELSRTVKRLAETARAIARSEPRGLRTDSVRNPLGGHPTAPDSLRAVAERIGVPPATINAAEQHVAALDRYPELDTPEMPAQAARTIARHLDVLPEPVRVEKREEIKSVSPAEAMRIVRDVVPGATDRMDAANLLAQYARYCVKVNEMVQLDPSDVALLLNDGDKTAARWLISSFRAWLDRFESELGRGIHSIGGTQHG